MKKFISWLPVLSALVLGSKIIMAAPSANSTLEAGASPKAGHLWKPIPDDVFLQEMGEKILTPKPVTSVAVFDGTAYVVVGGALQRVQQGALVDAPGAPTNVTRLRALGGALWAVGGGGTYRFNGQKWSKVDERAFVDFCLHEDQVYGATRDDLFRWDGAHFANIRPPEGYASSDVTLTMEDSSQVLPDPVQLGPIQRIGSYSGTLYMLRPGGLALLEGKTFVPDPIDWGALPSPETRDLLVQGGRLYVATDRGVGVLRGMAMTALADIGMIFIRCAGGVSHNPAEAITEEDAAIGAEILLSFIRNFTPREKLPA